MKINSIRGVRDILPGEVEKWQHVERVAHEIFARYGFREIRIPVFEHTALFARGIGDTTDIVEKEMYTFTDRGGDQITLRPEGTASVVRAYVEHKMHHPPGLVKLYYMGPMFRYERPQAGRFRQFHQIGVEAMGSSSPMVDAECMRLLADFLDALGLKNCQLQINSLGCPQCRPAYRDVLKNAIRGSLDQLCDNCRQRFEKNPLRVLDCKVERDQAIAKELPKTADHLCVECKDHFTAVQLHLQSSATPFTLNPQLVRGLDYYSRTTFEVTAGGLGSQNAVCGGGRYDSLVEEFEGPPTPCFGFALGVERLVSILPQEQTADLAHRPDVFIVALGVEAENHGFALSAQLRQNGLRVDRDYEGGSMKSQMRKANQKNARYVLILGENEIKSGKLMLKDMASGEQAEVAPGDVAAKIKHRSAP